jgi:hypothetical protein
MRVNTSCYYALKRRGGVKILVTAMNRKECSSSVEYIKLNEPVTDPDHLKQAEADGKKAAKILAESGKGNRRNHKATGKVRTELVDPGIADPVAPEAPPSPPKKAAVKKKLTAKQVELQKAARKKAAEKKKEASEQSKKDEAAAA